MSSKLLLLFRTVVIILRRMSFLIHYVWKERKMAKLFVYMCRREKASAILKCEREMPHPI